MHLSTQAGRSHNKNQHFIPQDMLPMAVMLVGTQGRRASCAERGQVPEGCFSHIQEIHAMLVAAMRIAGCLVLNVVAMAAHHDLLLQEVLHELAMHPWRPGSVAAPHQRIAVQPASYGLLRQFQTVHSLPKVPPAAHMEPAARTNLRTKHWGFGILTLYTVPALVQTC